MSEITLRVAAPEDAEALLAIYSHYVLRTAITYEYAVPSPEEFAGRIRHTLEKYPYLVVEADGVPVGYAYAAAFHPRAAYGWTAEGSIYLEQGCHRRGLGRRLYTALEEALRRQGVQNLNACVAVPDPEDEYLTRNSLDFHLRMGYRLTGELRRCGYKFGRWYGMAYLEKELGAHPTPPPPVRPFPEIRAGFEAWLAENGSIQR